MDLNYFDDLTNYSNNMGSYDLPGVKNVGWIDLSSEYTKGKVPEFFLVKLKSLLVGNKLFNAVVEPIRTLPFCPICGELKIADGAGFFLPDAELWIPAQNMIFASPITIAHYVEVHDYLPPKEYIQAIEELNVNLPFNGEEVMGQCLKASAWFTRPR